MDAPDPAKPAAAEAETPTRATPRAPWPSAARQVTLFEDRAEVARVAKVRVTAGAGWIAIGGVSVFVDERTVQARALGFGAEGAVRRPGAPNVELGFGAEGAVRRPGAPIVELGGAPDGDGAAVRVTAARVRWRAHGDGAAGREVIEALEAEERAAARRVEAAVLARDRAARREAQVNQLLSRWARAIATAPQGARAESALAAWRSSLEALDRAADAALRALAEASAEHARAEDDRRRAAERLREGAPEKPRYEAVIEVEVHAAAAQEVEIEVGYRVACALWRPEHLARLRAARGAANGPRDTVDLVTWATAWQATGEVWENVVARFSTARPARSASPPEIQDDVLRMRRKAEPRRVVVEARDQAIVAAGLDRGARAVDEMPGVDDGGEPMVYEAPSPVTLPSDGRPLRVEVVRRALPAEVALVIFPEAHPAAHLRATITLADGADAGAKRGPLLAGPVRIARGDSLVGRGRVGFVGLGEPFEIGFGVDDAVRVRRTVDEERDTAAITGTRRIRRKVKIYLSNLSGGAKRVVVTERVPVSEVAEVEIGAVEAPGFRLEERDGFLHGRFDLAPNETRAVSFSYEIRAASNAVLPF